MNAITILLFIVSVVLVNCNDAPVRRDPRFIRGTYTNIVTETRVVTSLIPSSCVYVDASLPPCRNVRYMRFPNFLANGWQNNEDENLVRSETNPAVQSTMLGWGEYFGIYAPTVTVTNTHIQTAIVKDPRIVVTFAVKGCRPLRIPNDLERCPEDNLPTISIQEILPTSTIPAIHTSTTINPHHISTPKNARFIDLAAANAYETMRKINDINQHLQHSAEIIESSSNKEENFESAKPTEALPI